MACLHAAIVKALIVSSMAVSAGGLRSTNMLRFQECFAQCFKLEYCEAVEALQTALANDMDEDIEDLVAAMQEELRGVAHLERPYLLYALTFEQEDSYLFQQMQEVLQRPWQRMVCIIESASSEEEWMLEMRDHLVEAVKQGWKAGMQAARAEMVVQLEAWHTSKLHLRSHEFLPRLLLPKNAQPVDVAFQLSRELPWVML
jgi:hypothetical protein